MRFGKLVGTAALLTVPALVNAEFNYKSIDFSYVDVESDVSIFNIDGDGFQIGGTFPVAERFYVGAEYSDYGFDFGVDGEVLEIGGGYFHMLSEDLDFVATFGYADAEVSVGNLSADNDGLTLGGGVRARLGDMIEVDAGLRYIDWDEGGSDTGIRLRGRYYFSEEFAVTAGTDLGSDFETLSIGIRAEF